MGALYLPGFPRFRLVHLLLLCLCLSCGTTAEPSTEPKPWKVQPHGRVMRKRMTESLEENLEVRETSPNSTGTCMSRPAAVIVAPNANVWNGLTDEESVSVVAWLFARPEFNLTVTGDADRFSNVLVDVGLMSPKKSLVLSYIDGHGPAPARWAHAIVSIRATDDPYYQEILVGPLPLNNATATWQPLEEPFTRKTEGKVRNLDADYDAYYNEWLVGIGKSLKNITESLWGLSVTGGDDDKLIFWGIDPVWHEDGRTIRWDTFWRSGDGIYDVWTLQPLGLFIKSDVTGRDPAKWKVLAVLYNNIMYDTVDEFRNAFWSPGFVKLGGETEGDWSHPIHQGVPPPMDTQPAPEAIAPGGSRFGLDVGNQYVEWMDFSFFIGFDRDRGMTLYDIKYQGERIIYELGLQEALAHYASNDPTQSGTAYLDTFYGVGPYSFELVEGYDCPSYATYLDTKFYMEETTHTHIKSICLFEFEADAPLQRHTTGEYVSVTKNIYFTVRFVATVGNYDYTFSYSFYLDGSISVDVRASGYIQAQFYAHNEDYGFQIHDFLSGSMHDHVLNFKADFDILGGANTVQLMTLAPVSKVYPWSKGQARNTMQLQRAFVESEATSRFDWAANHATEVLVVNTDRPNRFGVARGYRVAPLAPTIHLTVRNSSDLGRAAAWAATDLAVTAAHDDEPRSAHRLNSQDVDRPVVDFDAFFDGESLRQTDLVLWLNLGMHHVPHTGDLPNTVTTGARSGVLFSPSNYFDADQSRRSTQMVRVEYRGGKAEHVETYGRVPPTCTVALSPVEERLWGYSGDVVVRKFPYDPNDPWYETVTSG